MSLIDDKTETVRCRSCAKPVTRPIGAITFCSCCEIIPATTPK